MSSSPCNCQSSSLKDEIEDLQSQLRILTASLEDKEQQLEEKEQQLEDEVMKNLELEEQISTQQEKMDEKDEENRQLLRALLELQEAFSRFQETFEQKINESEEVIEKPREINPKFTFDVTESTLLAQTHQTLAWDDFCPGFEHEDEISPENSTFSSNIPENDFKFRKFSFSFTENLKNKKISTDCSRKIPQKFKSQSSFVQCKFCNKILPNSKSLMWHMDLHEQKCKFEGCGKAFAKKFSLKNHMKSHKRMS